MFQGSYIFAMPVVHETSHLPNRTCCSSCSVACTSQQASHQALVVLRTDPQIPLTASHPFDQSVDSFRTAPPSSSRDRSKAAHTAETKYRSHIMPDPGGHRPQRPYTQGRTHAEQDQAQATACLHCTARTPALPWDYRHCSRLSGASPATPLRAKPSLVRRQYRVSISSFHLTKALCRTEGCRNATVQRASAGGRLLIR